MLWKADSKGELGIGSASWRQILNDEYGLPPRLAKIFLWNFFEGVFFEVADGSLRAVAEGFRDEDATVAERDFRGLLERALVKPVGTGIITVRHSLARRQRSLRALVEAFWV